jgi:hypothetical protein
VIVMRARALPFLALLAACSSEGSIGLGDGPVLVDVTVIDAGFRAKDAQGSSGDDAALASDAAAADAATIEDAAGPEDAAPIEDAAPMTDAVVIEDAAIAEDGTISEGVSVAEDGAIAGDGGMPEDIGPSLDAARDDLAVGRDAPAQDALPGDANVTPDAGAICLPPQDACTTCVSNACNPIYCGCYGTADCPPLVDCAARCAQNDAACLQACWSMYPNGISDAFLAADCATQSCSGVCPSTGVLLSTCNRCLFTSCESEMNACLSVTECSRLVGCLGFCGANNPSCTSFCYAQYPQAASLGQAVERCGGARCPTECP